jgi:hypothetical protein
VPLCRPRPHLEHARPVCHEPRLVERRLAVGEHEVAVAEVAVDNLAGASGHRVGSG